MLSDCTEAKTMMRWGPSDNCVYHNHIKILILFEPELPWNPKLKQIKRLVRWVEKKF